MKTLFSTVAEGATPLESVESFILQLDAMEASCNTTDMAVTIAEKVLESVETFGMSEQLTAFVGSDYDGIVEGRSFASLSAEEATEGLLDAVKDGAAAIWKWIIETCDRVWKWLTGFFKKSKADDAKAEEVKVKVDDAAKEESEKPSAPAPVIAKVEAMPLETPAAVEKAVETKVAEVAKAPTPEKKEELKVEAKVIVNTAYKKASKRIAKMKVSLPHPDSVDTLVGFMEDTVIKGNVSTLVGPGKTAYKNNGVPAVDQKMLREAVEKNVPFETTESWKARGNMTKAVHDVISSRIVLLKAVKSVQDYIKEIKAEAKGLSKSTDPKDVMRGKVIKTTLVAANATVGTAVTWAELCKGVTNKVDQALPASARLRKSIAKMK